MNLDVSIFRAINGLAGQSAFSDWIFVFLSNYLIHVVVILAAIFFLLWKRTWQEKLKVILIALVTAGVSYLIVAVVFHPLWPRLRPFDGLLNVNQLVSESGLSFPSKHAVFAFFIATFVFGFNKRAAYGLFILAILVCLGRVLVGVHYPLDVLVGAIFGAVMGCLAFKIYKKFS